MMSKEADKIQVAFDRVDAALDHIAEIPPDELTFEEKLTLWAQLERLRLRLVKAAYRAQSAAS